MIKHTTIKVIFSHIVYKCNGPNMNGIVPQLYSHDLSYKISEESNKFINKMLS